MYKLVIGNKNYSSWSLRAWILLTELGIPFQEVNLSLQKHSFDGEVRKYSPSRRVPVMWDDDLPVWDSLSIAEYVAEARPDLPVWPRERSLRAIARSVCAEMHSGFGALRSKMPMNVTASLPGMGWDIRVQGDIDRIVEIWKGLRETAADLNLAGPFLCGGFGAVDAFFAPVVSRFKTHAVSLPPFAQTYALAVQNCAAMRAWTEAAMQETEFLEDDEPYRTSR